MLMSLAVPLMLLSAWMLTPAALMLLLALRVGIGPLYTSTEDLEGRIKKTAVNSTLSGNNITLNANNNINAAGVNIQASFLSSSGFLAIVPSTSARLTFTFLCLE
jgi:hypothetical protein